MKLSILICLMCPYFYSQIKYDTVINLGIYKSYFNKEIKQPIAVTYTLYHGGGNASRNNDHFKSTSITLNDTYYLHSGYDRGHLVPAEDFAYSDSLQALTFSYYNCGPQLPELNRGKWKHYESEVRKLSQKDTILVVCYFEHLSIGARNIPDACYKTVYDKTGSLLLIIGLENRMGCMDIIPGPEVLNLMRQLGFN